jgi:ligand-binding sensor domain-containing protein/signal transduction histidine kinase
MKNHQRHISGFLLFLSFLLFQIRLDAQEEFIKFKHLTLNEGLSHSNVQCILRDRRGFMWFGTEDGLNRYDGTTFKIYRHDPADPRSLSCNMISTLIEDKRGNLWIGTVGGGLNRYDRNNDDFIYFPIQDPDSSNLGFLYIHALIEDRDGKFWIGFDTGGLLLFDPVTGVTVAHFKTNSAYPNCLGYDDIRALCEDSRRNIWIGFLGGGLDRLDPRTGSFFHYTHVPQNRKSLSCDEINSIFEDSQKNIWIGTYGGGLEQYDGKSDGFLHLKHNPDDPRSIGDDFIFSITEDASGNLWVGTENNGIQRFDRTHKTFTRYVNETYNDYSLTDNSVESVYADTLGFIWIGTYNGGVNYLYTDGEKFRHYRQTPQKNSLSKNAVLSFCEDRKGRVWVGTDGGGLNAFDRKKGTFVHFRNDPKNDKSLSQDAVLTIYEDRQENFWVGTYAGGLNLFDRDSRTFTRYLNDPGNPNSLSSNDVRAIYQDSNGYFWIGTAKGLDLFDRKKGTFRHFRNDATNHDSLSFDIILLIYEDRQSNLWFGTYGGGLNLYNRKKGSFIRFKHDEKIDGSLSDNFVYSMLEDSRGRFWVGTGEGLNLLDRRSRRFTHFRIRQGLRSDFISGILEDNRGNLWLSTHNGLSKFNPEKNTFRNYDAGDGLQGNDFHYGTTLKTRDGTLFFGGVNGFNVFNPDAVKDNPHIPPVRIVDFQIFNKSVPIGAQSSPLKKSISESERLSLSYKHSMISFSFAALNYFLPEKNQYAYKLQGFEKEWNYIGTQRTATYTNLDAGEYVLRVKGSNNDGLWNESGVSLIITVSPPFWKTGWFRLAVSLFVIVSVFFAYRIRTSSMLARTRFLEQINRRLNVQIAHRKAAEDKIQRLNEELEQRVAERTAQLQATNRELEAFAYSVSHDLRAPLRSLDGFSQALREDYGDRLDETGLDYCRRLCAASQQMGRLIDDLLKLSRLTRSEMRVEKVNLSALVQAIARECSDAEPARKIRFVIAKGISVQGDAPLLRVMLKNLIENACKFTGRRADAMIEFGVIQKETQPFHFIKDNGVGFNMQYVDKLFNAFQRLHTVQEFEGTGIGLATVQRIVHRHGGRIWAEAEEGTGATFYFTIERSI